MVNELTARSRAGTAPEVAGLHHAPPWPLAAAGFCDSPESRPAPHCCQHPPQSRQGQSLAARSPGARAQTLSMAWEIHKQGFLLYRHFLKPTCQHGQLLLLPEDGVTAPQGSPLLSPPEKTGSVACGVSSTQQHCAAPQGSTTVTSHGHPTAFLFHASIHHLHGISRQH